MVVNIQLADLEPLDVSKHDRAAFSCIDKRFETYLQNNARKDQESKSCVCYVLTESGANAIIGYYTLSATRIDLSELPEALRKKLPSYPGVPATILGRLAASNKDAHKGERLGEYLLLDALHRAWETSKVVASYALILDANTNSKGFYERYKFHSFNHNELKMYMTMNEIELLFSDASQ